MKTSLLKWTAGTCLAALAFGCATKAPETLYEQTLSHVDRGGLTLYYNETEPLVPLLRGGMNKLHSLTPKTLQDPMQRMIADAVIEAGGMFLEDLNPDVVKSCAISVVKAAKTDAGEQLYETKTFSYTGEKPSPSLLLDIFNMENRDFKYLPLVSEDAFLFIDWSWNPEALFNGLKKTAKKLPQPQLALMLDMAELKFEQTFGVKLPLLLATLSGENLVSLAAEKGNGQQVNLQFLFIVPDRNGSLRKLLPPMVRISDDCYALPLQTPFQWRMQVRFTADSVRFASMPDRFAPAQKMIDSPFWQAYTAGLPRSGFAFCGMRISPELLNIATTLNPGAANDLAPFGSMIPVLTGYSVSFRAADGFQGVGRSNFRPDVTGGTSSIIASTSILAGMILPALNQARERARQISCVANVKQLSLGLAMYTADHHNLYPAQNGVAGLQEILPYVNQNKELFRCPSRGGKIGNAPLTEAACDYYFLGGGINQDSIEKPSDTPILLEKPNCHKNAVVIGFANGHVECMKFTNYTHPMQAIQKLRQKNRINDAQVQRIAEILKSL